MQQLSPRDTLCRKDVMEATDLYIVVLSTNSDFASLSDWGPIPHGPDLRSSRVITLRVKKSITYIPV